MILLKGCKGDNSRYVRKYKVPLIEEVFSLIRELNTKYFQYGNDVKLLCGWNHRLHQTSGTCVDGYAYKEGGVWCFTEERPKQRPYVSCWSIELSPEVFQAHPTQLASTLVHELLHVKYLDHGPEFRQALLEISKVSPWSYDEMRYWHGESENKNHSRLRKAAQSYGGKIKG